MDPTTYGAKLDQATKSIIILLAAVSVCVGFFLKLIDDQAFMPFVYTVIGAAFGRGMAMMPNITKTTETTPDGGKKETMTTSTAPAVTVPVSGTTTTVTTPSTSTTTTHGGGT